MDGGEGVFRVDLTHLLYEIVCSVPCPELTVQFCTTLPRPPHFFPLLLQLLCTL